MGVLPWAGNLGACPRIHGPSPRPTFPSQPSGAPLGQSLVVRRLAVGALIAFVLSCFAYPPAAGAVTLKPGIVVALRSTSFQHLSTPAEADIGSRTLPAVGAACRLESSGPLAITLNAVYGAVGETFKSSDVDFQKSYTVTERSATGTALLSCRVFGRGRVEAGTSLGRVLTAKAVGSYATAAGRVAFDEDYLDRTDRWDTLWTGGAGWSFPIGGHRLDVDLLYSRSLENLDRTAHGVPPSQRPPAWTGIPWPFPDPSKTRIVELALTACW